MRSKLSLECFCVITSIAGALGDWTVSSRWTRIFTRPLMLRKTFTASAWLLPNIFCPFTCKMIQTTWKIFKGGNGFVSCSLCLSINIPETGANQNQVKIHKKPITVKKTNFPETYSARKSLVATGFSCTPDWLFMTAVWVFETNSVTSTIWSPALNCPSSIAAPFGRMLFTNIGVFPPAGLSREVMLNPRPSVPDQKKIILGL